MTNLEFMNAYTAFSNELEDTLKATRKEATDSFISGLGEWWERHPPKMIKPSN